MRDIFPQDEGWLLPGLDDPVRMSSLTINWLTKYLTSRDKSYPPSCEAGWAKAHGWVSMGYSFPWKKFWRSLGTFLTSKTDEKQWLRLVHRNSYVVSHDKDYPSDMCRACNRSRESMNHWLTCPRIDKVFTFVRLILTLLGTNLNTLNTSWSKIFPFGIGPDEKPLPEAQRAVLILSWRVIFAHLTKVSSDNGFFQPKMVIKDIAHRLMSRILAQQEERSLYYWGRLHSPYTCRLPIKLCEKFLPLGDLDPETGSLKIKSSLVELFKEHKVWTEHPHRYH